MADLNPTYYFLYKYRVKTLEDVSCLGKSLLKQFLFQKVNLTQRGMCDLSEQRNNQSDFSFELEGLSAKFAGLKDDIKKK